MKRRPNRYIDAQEELYLELLIADPEAENRKVGLEKLCKLYRQGLILRRTDKIRIFSMGLLHDSSPRVVRWALNTLSLLGTASEVKAIAEAITRNSEDPDVLAAGVSALCGILDAKSARTYLEKVGLALEGAVILAASQQSTHFDTELRRTRIDIERADVTQLRLAGILLGLKRAPPNVFSLNHANNKVVGQLNRHPDRVVAQYSV